MSHAAMTIPGLDRVGGAEQQAISLAKGLRRRGWRVSVVALSGTGGAAAAELAHAGIAFLSLQMRKGLADPRGWIRFQRWLWREQPDVLHAHLPHAAWLARWSRLAAPVPIVVDTLHSSSTGTMGRHFGYSCSRWLPDHVTAVSQATAASHLAAGMVSESKLSVVWNGIDVDRWQPDAQERAQARAELGIRDEFLWLAVGRLEAVKDYPCLLRAMIRTPERARLLVLGAGPQEDRLTELAEWLGLKRRVRFAGFEPNVARWMRAADGFVLSSRYEGLPMVLLEAGACGVPIVATDVPGTREVVVDGETGWLAPAGDAEELAKTMMRLMRMPPDARQAMGELARRHVAEHFSLEAALDRWERLYANLLEWKNAARHHRLPVWEILRRRSAHTA
ncbi:MAG: glycosyltransferase [Terracidiphilus sp.]|jgi:glycosyltransferase involved in cell wall biosynthesis